MTETDHLLNLHGDVLAAMRRGPKHFAKLAFVLAESDEPADVDLSHFRDRLNTGDSELIALWRRSLTAWDLDENAVWAQTPARTDARRHEAYDKLAFGADLRKALDTSAPVFKEPGTVVISDEFQSWYSKDTAAPSSFYWTGYEKLLREKKGWGETAIATLDQASHAVVERLADPARSDAYGARGLVVGHVQSGKTANFTGVTAKAIDAGYRLVIVLGGTLNLLRGQTQRRLDMELIGQENILRGADPADLDSLIGIDYQDDEDWPHKFVSHGGRPSTHGACDIERLTTRDEDYRRLAQGIRALDYEKVDRTRPLYDPANLHHAAARVMVVKKNKTVLQNLVKDLKKIGPILGEIPALIIDDESDQASVNTTDPKKWEAGTVSRTAINGLITQLLKLLPRAQYVGYTATPFANVFIDPGDGDDLFPRHFLISLPRPSGYMGVQEFHDLDSPIPVEERTYANSQEKAHVRGIYDDTGDRLQEAMDAFVLSGALKLYRAAHGVPAARYRHHTMLVHESVRMADHAALALRLNSMWHESGYRSDTGHARLEALFASDFQQVSAHRSDDLPTPATYADLRPYVSTAHGNINAGGNPIVIVNGDTDRDFAQVDLDFDGTPHVWKILVGGTKLSRGFTVEGLTVTYYRRTTQQADTLMQMGRWFGFRAGYQDLVRLYIGREEPYGKSKTVDLYEAFEAICRDEETFRDQLAQYAELVDGKPQVTPGEIPPLVAQHLPWVKPSARNKMFNAELVEVRSPGQIVEPTAHPIDADSLKDNTKLWLPLLDQLGTERDEFTYHHEGRGRTYRLSALTASVSHEDLMQVLNNLTWWNPAAFQPNLEYLQDLSRHPHLVDDWLLIAPQHTSGRRLEASIQVSGSVDSRPLAISHRQRRRVELFGSISDPKHRATALRIAGALPKTADHVTEAFTTPRRGAVLLYPVIEESPETAINAHGAVDASKVAMVFSLVAPSTAITPGTGLLRFRAINSALKDPIISPS